MGTHMKTTIDIADPLLERARAVAREQGVTLRELVETGLVRILAERTGSASSPFRLRDVAFRGGHGLQEAFAGADPSLVLTVAYEGRGG
jgi:hypothetical protein